MNNGEIITRGTIGTGASLGAYIFTVASEINPLLQSVSLLLGIGIGGITLFKLVTKNKRKD
jgi:hypothetical protein